MHATANKESWILVSLSVSYWQGLKLETLPRLKIAKLLRPAWYPLRDRFSDRPLNKILPLAEAGLVENFYNQYLASGNNIEIKEIEEAEHGFVSF